MLRHLTPEEQEQAVQLAESITIELKFDREIGASEHVAAAALSAKLLLIAAHFHCGDSSSFTSMAGDAFARACGRKGKWPQ